MTLKMVENGWNELRSKGLWPVLIYYYSVRMKGPEGSGVLALVTVKIMALWDVTSYSIVHR